LPTRKRRLYWDASGFIALFDSEPTTPSLQLDALRATFEEMLDGQVKIITSDLYRAEAAAIAEQLEACPDFEMVPLRTQAYEMAGDLRKRCHDATPTRKLKTPDALHVAAGTIARADEIWTTETKLVSYYEAGLLTSVRVCVPHLKQVRILFKPEQP